MKRAGLLMVIAGIAVAVVVLKDLGRSRSAEPASTAVSVGELPPIKRAKLMPIPTKTAEQQGTERADRADREKKQEASLLAELTKGGVELRKNYAKNLEVEYLKKYIDAHVSTVGKDATTLRIEFVLMSRPLAYNMMNDKGNLRALRTVGFKKAVLKNQSDFAEEWTLEK